MDLSTYLPKNVEGPLSYMTRGPGSVLVDEDNVVATLGESHCFLFEMVMELLINEDTALLTSALAGQTLLRGTSRCLGTGHSFNHDNLQRMVVEQKDTSSTVYLVLQKENPEYVLTGFSGGQSSST
jgi:hypothetical protein